MDLPRPLLNFFFEQKTRYGELFWYEIQKQENGKTKLVLMVEKLAEKARQVLAEEKIENIKVVSFEADDSIGQLYFVDENVLSMYTRPSAREYENVFDKKLSQDYTDWQNDLVKNELIRVFQPEQIKNAFAVVVYHSFNRKAPRALGWLSNLNGLKRLNQAKFVKPKVLKDLKSICQDLENLPYRTGGKSVEHGFDCSGLAQKIVYETKGIWLPRKAEWQAMVCEKIDPFDWLGGNSERSRTIEQKDLRPGDLIFFNKRGEKRIGHVVLLYEVQDRKLPARGGPFDYALGKRSRIVIFHSNRGNHVVFDDLDTAEGLNKWEINSFGRVIF
jgi:hypothetical protein